jgi:hypothetical protein
MSHYLKTSLEGKVKNMPNFHSESLLPLFEAIVNSIQAIQENGGPKPADHIVVSIKRDARQKKMSFASDDIILDFEIEDTGIGFNNENFESFETSDSIYKLEKGCKGVGRFFWLRAFDHVEIESVFIENSETKKRTIHFSLKKGIESSLHLLDQTTLPKTIVKLVGFKEEYRKQQSAYKTTKKIAQRILEHCLSSFINKEVPKIIVQDENESFQLEDMFREIENNMTSEDFMIKDKIFHLSHVKLYSTSERMHNLVLCATGRDVLIKNISQTLGVSEEFDIDTDRKFIYAAYLSSPYLDKYVNIGRMSFDIPNVPQLTSKDDDSSEIDSQISLLEIEKSVTEKIKSHLAPYLEVLRKYKEEKISDYIAKENPTLRFVPHYNPDVYNEIQTNSSNEKIDEILYKYKGKAEYELKKRGAALLKTQVNSYSEIQEDVDKIKTQLEEIQKDQLASYIIFRKMIIDLLAKKLELNNDKKYANEDIIHDIIFPRKNTSDEISFDNHNLWLIDERLAFHTLAVSETAIAKYSDSDSKYRPDIVIFSEVDPDRIARTVSIIEFKKPQKSDYDEDITAQLYRYVRQIKNSKMKNDKGRTIQIADVTKFYCYAICDITKAIETFVENQSYTKLNGELGYYYYNSKLNTHIEIIDFDKIVADAEKRHRIFFEKLGIQ